MIIETLQKRKIRVLIALLSLAILLSNIQSSFAKYVSSADAIANLTISRWNIIVNNQDILENNDFSDTIVPTFDSNTNIADNVLAPTATGSIVINIDGTNTDVSYQETIEFALSNDTTIADLKITGYKVNQESIVTLGATDPRQVVLQHARTDTSKIDNITIYFEWVDGTGETMNNLQDAAATRNAVAKVDVSVDFIQLAT